MVAGAAFASGWGGSSAALWRRDQGRAVCAAHQGAEGLSRAAAYASEARDWHRAFGFQAFHTARRPIQGFEAMLWLRKGFGFAGAWTVREQNRLLALCFGLPEINKV